jgi:hypothetical protein
MFSIIIVDLEAGYLRRVTFRKEFLKFLWEELVNQTRFESDSESAYNVVS